MMPSQNQKLVSVPDRRGRSANHIGREPFYVGIGRRCSAKACKREQRGQTEGKPALQAAPPAVFGYVIEMRCHFALHRVLQQLQSLSK